MKIGIRLPQTGEDHVTKKYHSSCKRDWNAGCFKLLWVTRT